MNIKINRGTNPKLKYTIQGITLAKGDDSFVTIRKDIEGVGSVDSTAGELQIACNSAGEVTDALGNKFKIDGNEVSLELTRAYTKTMEYPMYWLQFNLKTSTGVYIVNKPFIVEVLVNVANL